MDLLRRAFAQLHDRFRSMTPGSRLMAALLAAAVLVGLVYLGTQQRRMARRRPDARRARGEEPPAANDRRVRQGETDGL